MDDIRLHGQKLSYPTNKLACRFARPRAEVGMQNTPAGVNRTGV